MPASGSVRVVRSFAVVTIAALIASLLALGLTSRPARGAEAAAAAKVVKCTKKKRLTAAQRRARARKLARMTRRQRVAFKRREARREAARRKACRKARRGPAREADAPGGTPRPNPAPAPAAPAPPPAAGLPDARPPVRRAGTMEGWNGYGAGSWPGADWRPYSDASPFNRRLDGAVVHPNSDAIVRKILSWGKPADMVAGVAGTTSDYGHPTYWSQPSDPRFTLRATGTPNAIQNTQIPIPDAARPAGGGDGHMTVVTPEGWEYDFWQVASKPAGGGTLSFSIGGRIPIDGDGLDGKATAALFGNLAGIIRAPEMAAGEIDHALFVVLKCSSATTAYGYGTVVGPAGQSAYVWPATHGASRCSSAEDVDAPPLGARLQLAMSDAEIAALDVPQWKKTILTALAHYGGYFGDTGGSGFGLMFESGATYTSFGVTDPLVTFAAQNGLPARNGQYVFDVASGVDWARYLRVVVPPSR